MSPVCKTAEFIPGYTLRERIGAGGYGEVWKAEAPGGLLKAVKFVYGCLNEERASRELKALGRIREVRHPFLLSLERIEVIDGQLVVITELADASLRDRYDQCRAEGKEGIPRDELLVHLRDAADALDYMGENFSLQHLDVKPENLLLVGGRVKVGDFGLVKDMQDVTVSLMGALTPVYAAPEVFDGHPCLHSDQYSLAIVYQEMLSGTLPFPGKTASQLATQHLHSKPLLTPVPPTDRPILARALAKDPNDRFPSCRALVDDLSQRMGTDSGRRTPAAASPAGEPLGGDTRSAAAPSQDTERPARSAPAGSPPPVGEASLFRTLPFEAIDVPAALGASSEDEDPWIEPAGRDAERLADWPLPLAAVEPTMEDLPPLEVAPDEAGPRPVLVLGMGGTAARALRQLRQRWCERFEDMAAMPAFGMLLLDTDPQTIADATSGNSTAALDLSQTLTVPLRTRGHYDEQWEKHSRWLSRRWLCNMPRSQRTEGLRPLGRLALVDHAEEVFARLQAVMERIVAPTALATSAKLAAMPVRNTTPIIFLVASISGGTGSGIVFDLAYTVRKLLGKLSLPEASLCGILVHSTPRDPSGRMLANLNACACLRELQHYSGGAGYPGDTLCDLPAFAADVPPFDDTYLVHLGDDLGEQDFQRATDDLAEQLYLATSTPAGALLEKLRAAGRGRQKPASGEVTVRSFGLCRLAYSQRDLASAAADVICRRIAEVWNYGPQTHLNAGGGTRGAAARRARTQPATGAACCPADVGPSAVDGADPGRADFEQILGQVREAIDAELDGNAEEVLVRMLLSMSVRTGSSGKPTGHLAGPRAAIRAIDERLAPLWPSGPPRSPDRTTDRSAHLAGRIEELAAACAASLIETPLRNLSEPGAAAQAADSAAQSLMERLAALKVEADETQGRLGKAIAEAARELGDEAIHIAVRQRRWLGIGCFRKPRVDHRWSQYARLRIDREVLEGATRLLRLLEPKLASIARQWKSFGQELRALAGVFLRDCENGSEFVGEAPRASAADLKAAVADLLKDRLPDLALQFDRRWRAELLAAWTGPSATANEQGDLRRDVADPWRRAAHGKVLEILREGRSAQWLSPLVSDFQAAPDAVRACVERAAPLLAAFGGMRHGLVTCPAESLGGPLHDAMSQAAGLSPSVVVDPHADLMLCCEMEAIPLAQVAAQLVENRPDYARLARRLLTRVDMAW